jgi:PAS domain S-box-containing protein
VPDAGRFEALALSQQALLSAGADLDRIFDVIVDRSRAAIPRAHGVIVELLQADDLLYRAASGQARRYVGQRLPVAGSVAGRSIATGAPMIVADLEQEASIDLDRYRDVGMRALIAVPFGRGNRSIGALKFYSSEPAAFAAIDLTIARLIAGQLVASLTLIDEQTAVRERSEATAHIRKISETLQQLIWTVTSSGVVVSYNRRADEFLQFDRLKAGGIDILSMIDPDSSGVDARWTQAKADSKPFSFECQLAPKSGPPRWFLIDVAPILADAVQTGEWICVGTDIDERKTLEFSLQEAVRSRELLLSEVNHRAKNSLQIISGLLAMHASRIVHPEAKARLLDARTQIGTIAQIHDTIHQSAPDGQVEFVGFLRNLATGLVGSASGKRAHLVFDTPDTLLLPIDRGVPVALIASEIVTNAIKHAIAHDDACITIAIRHDAHGCIIDIADNGPGLPPDFDPQRSEGLGMDIMFGLAEQAGAHLAIARAGEGARFSLHLPC